MRPGVLCVLNHCTAMDYITGRFTRPQDWLSEARLVMIAWEFN